MTNWDEQGQILTGREATERYIDLLTGSVGSAMAFRVFCDDQTRNSQATSYFGTLDQVALDFERAQADGCGVFAVVNHGGHCDADITEVRAVFIDADDVPLEDMVWPVQPDFIVYRDGTHWHAYWLVRGIGVHEFRALQKRLAKHYGTDAKVCNPSRVMRLPGYLHQKDPSNPTSVVLIDLTSGGAGDCHRDLNGHSATSVSIGLDVGVSTVEHVAQTTPAVVVPLDMDENVQQAIKLVCSRAPAIHHQGGDDHTYKTACAVKDFAISEGKCVELLLEHWNDQCEPPWNERELALKVKNAYRYGKEAIGVKADALPAFGGTGNGSVRFDDDADRPLTGAELKRGDYPPPSFVVDGLIVKGEVNLLYGDGGTGKTTLALQIAAAVAAGQRALGVNTIQMPALLVLAEDDKGETKRRLEAICDHIQADLGAIPIHIWARPGENSTLAVVEDNGTLKPAPFMARLRAQIAKIGPCLVVLDSLADVAILDEIKRQPVNALFKQVFGKLCRDLNVTLLVLGHPSKAGMTDGSNYSGSTAFNNAVRQRLTLEANPDDPLDTQRTLDVAKANYARRRSIDLFLNDGFFSTINDAKVQERTLVERERVFDVVEGLLERGEQIVNSNGNGLKPRDIAAAVLERHRVKLPAKRVAEHLAALRMSGRLGYQNADNSKRNHRAGYFLPPAA